jgi:hypothetical protein
MDKIFDDDLEESKALHLTEKKELCSGIFWIISDNFDHIH